MKTAILLLVAILLNVGTGFPQCCYFHETYDYDIKHDHATSIIETSNGGFLSVGNAEIVANNEEGTYSLRTDNCGSIKWQSFHILSPAKGGGEAMDNY